MSYHNYEIIISPEAETDLEDIFLNGIQVWGVKQTRKYVTKLGKAIDGLHNFPNIGHNRNDVFPGCKTIHEGVHTIIYHIEGSVVLLIEFCTVVWI